MKHLWQFKLKWNNKLPKRSSCIKELSLENQSKEVGQLWGYQILIVFSVCYSCISCGNFLGYTSSAIPSMENDSKNFAILSSRDISLIGGLGPLGALLGSLLTVLPLRWLGPRRTIGLIGIPSILISWLAIGFCTNIYFIFAARFVGGVGCGFIITCAPLYIIDISSVARRGQLGIMPQFLMIFGILISYVLGCFLPWNHLAQASAFILAPSGFLILVAPDPPGWLVSRGHNDKAQKVLETLEDTKRAGEILQEIQNRLQAQNQHDPNMTLWNLRTLKSSLVSLGIISVQQFTGINGITFFALSIFNKSTVSEEDAMGHIPAIVLASTQLIASFMSTFFIEAFGRKCLLTISSISISLAATVLGLYFYLYTQVPLLRHFCWIPLVMLVIFAFGFSIGLGPVTWILVAEILPQETRNLINPLVIAYNWFCVFVVTSSFPFLMEAIDFYGIFWLYAGMGFLGLIFITVYVPETKGKNQAEIQAFFEP